MVNYYRDIWVRRSALLAPLTIMTSRSVKFNWTDVLRKEGVINPSPPPLKLLSVSDPPSSGSTCKHVCADAHVYTSVCASAHMCTLGVYEPHISPYYDKGKHTAKATPALSWAGVARKGQTRDRKEMGNPHSFYKI
jgi:hypothetical protein